MQLQMQEIKTELGIRPLWGNASVNESISNKYFVPKHLVVKK